jgi:hypothetical protein
LKIPENTLARIKDISSSTIDARLKPFKKNRLRGKICGTTKPGSLLKSQIPIRTSSWDESRIGYCELDTVAHCGFSAKGEFISTLNLTDMLTQWTESIAVVGRAQSRIIAGLEDIQNRLPFPLLAIDPDNGSEFINWQLFKYCQDKKVEFTRGRPYQKNDNAHIEEKNWTNVRKIFGYARMETDAEAKSMNDLYQNELRLYLNFFIPNVKLLKKQRVGKNQEKIKRQYDRAKTPYRRVLECANISAEIKKRLIEKYETLNPAALRKSIAAKLKILKNLQPPALIHNQTTNIVAPSSITF